MFTADERNRYARQLGLPGFGPAAQERLREGRVLVVGCGGLGSPALAYLAAAGVGRIGFADPDLVDISNLHRQILHATTDIGRLKTVSAEARLRALNPHIHLEQHPLRLSPDNAHSVLSPYDFVIDATDSYAAKFLINDVCCAMRKPFVHAGLSAFGGQLLTVLPGRSPCLRCLFHDTPPEDGEGDALRSGPIGPMAGVLGALQAAEAIKFLARFGDLATGRLLLYDALASDFRSIQAAPSPACPACAKLFDRPNPRPRAP